MATPPTVPVAPPPLTPNPSPQNFTYVSHRYGEDQHQPPIGQLVLIRFDQPLVGPGSGNLSSSPPSHTIPDNSSFAPSRGSRRRKYHSAMVLETRTNLSSRMLLFRVFPIPSYSGAAQIGHTSESWVTQLSPRERMKHIPMPYLGGRGMTPPEFGDPVKPLSKVDGTEYFKTRPSWILVQEFIVAVPFTATWKSYNDIRFPLEDVVRLTEYYKTLQPSTINNDNNITANMVQLPDLPYPLPWFQDFSDSYNAVMHIIDPDSDDYDPKDDDDCPQYDTHLDFLRSIGTNDPEWIKLLEEDDRRKQDEKEERIKGWLEQVHGGAGWN